jgi:hypothetical protein
MLFSSHVTTPQKVSGRKPIATQMSGSSTAGKTLRASICLVFEIRFLSSDLAR